MNELPKMRSATEIRRIFLEADPQTRLRKMMLYTILSTKKISCVWLPRGEWRIDIDSFIRYFTKIRAEKEPRIVVPRLRHYEECYYLIKRDYSEIEITWPHLHAIVHSGAVRVFKYGNRWVLNYDELLAALRRN